jgi:hypothetical protein
VKEILPRGGLSYDQHACPGRDQSDQYALVDAGEEDSAKEDGGEEKCTCTLVCR